jgi:hypothetical protein
MKPVIALALSALLLAPLPASSQTRELSAS